MEVMIKVKRIYEGWEADDGCRVLVDRLWPRGVSKKAARLDLWLKEIAPSGELRRWFGHDPEKWNEFRGRYMEELGGKVAALDRLKDLAGRKKRLTILYGSRDTKHNEAVVLAELLRSKRFTPMGKTKACGGSGE